MNIQVFGHKGVLGKKVCNAAAAAGHAVLIDSERLENVWEHNILAPVVINCAGRIKQANAPRSVFMLDNAVGPHLLAEACNGVGSRLIHVSTDCVFQGGGPHDEDGIPDANDVYARSKLAGEVVYGPHLTLRTSFVGFGTKGLLNDLLTKKSVTVSRNLLWSGHTVDVVANLLILIAEKPQIVGLLHTPGTFQNRYGLARDLKSRWDLPAKLEREDDYVADRRLISYKWHYYDLPSLPSFEIQLTAMKGPND